jgi:S-adenosylmethionine:tRNA ribosyltransferase-isomerase
MRGVRRDDFRYELPPELIAQEPLPSRSASRLLVLEGRDGSLRDARFLDLPTLIDAGDLLVFNDTRVVNARLRARKPTGGEVELLLERVVGENRALFQARASKPLRPGAVLTLHGGGMATVRERQDDLFELDFDAPLLPYLASHGEVPLPPYIARPDSALDRERYQTVFARVEGAVAAPTAGLHFDEPMLATLDHHGVERTTVTLHVGAGTFQPVRSENLDEHQLHAEWLEVGESACRAIAAARRRRARVVAVGTTVARALESTWRGDDLRPCSGETRLFIRPGFKFRAIDALLTNFHLPESTLLMLVCAFGGYEAVMNAYRHAVRERYRFYSYGDAMLVFPAQGSAGSDA